MKDGKNNIDDLFRTSFEGYTVEPSGSVWKGIVRKYLNPGAPGLGLLSIQNIISIVLIVGAGISVYFVSPSMKDPEIIDVTNNNTTQSTIIQANNDITYALTNNPATIEQDESITIQQPTSPSPQSPNPPSFQSSNSPAPQAPNPPSLQQPITPSSPITSFQFSNTRIIQKGVRTSSVESENVQTNLYKDKNSVSTKRYNLLRLTKKEKDYFKNAHISKRYNHSQVPVQWNQDYINQSRWSVAIWFTPEWIYYPGDSLVRKNSYSLDLSAIYQKDQFILRSGIGMAISNDNGDIEINYEKYDSTGYYWGVNSFSIDPTNPDSPIFNTSLETVYDSVLYTTQEKPENKYTYLQIPLLAGYKVLDHKRISCSLLGGPVLSILIDKNEQTATFDDQNAHLISIDDNTPARLKTNWQFMISAGITYQVSNSLGIAIEPTYKYYIRSVYEQRIAGSKNPYSLGIRGGVIYSF